MKLSVAGAAKAQAALTRAAERLKDGFDRAVADTVVSLANEARQRAPHDTGRLRSAIKSKSDGGNGEVYVDKSVDYAAYVEFGTSTSPAHPFMGPASETHRARFVKRITDAGKGF